ncbi:ComEC/Rec2 family competence protein [Brotaphodocola sp.]|uniref:ComEC/Rec2 family competence protein n=1 Tax=Brotaphodocola sp. TaxID=3073577 RepID=UPI003D7E0068
MEQGVRDREMRRTRMSQRGKSRKRKRKNGRNPIPFLVALLAVGVIGIAGHHLVSEGMEASRQSGQVQGQENGQNEANGADEVNGTNGEIAGNFGTETGSGTGTKNGNSDVTENLNVSDASTQDTQSVSNDQAELITEGEKPESERDTTPLLGGAELRMLQSQTKGQMMSFLLKTKSGKLIVVDGGRWDDGDYLMEQIRKEGGHVSAWFLTHAHTDHVGALLKLLTNEADGEDTGITIDHIYYNFASVEWYQKHELGDLGTAMSILQQLSALPAGVCQTVKRGDEIEVDDVMIQVMNDRYEPEEVGERDGNDASVAYRMVVNGKSILFLGDLQKKGGAHLLEQAGGGLKSDMVQMAHHGQNGVEENVYEAIQPSICLWPTPQWLWDNEGGSYTTPETKAWVKKLNVSRNYCTKDGDQVIR